MRTRRQNRPRAVANAEVQARHDKGPATQECTGQEKETAGVDYSGEEVVGRACLRILKQQLKTGTSIQLLTVVEQPRDILAYQSLHGIHRNQDTSQNQLA